MVSIISLIVLGGFVTYLCFLQLQIIKYTRDRNDKLYCKILLVLFIAVNVWFYINIDVLFPVDIILILGYSIMIAFFWIFHLIIKYVFKSETIMRDRDTNFQETKDNLHEFLRKFFHFFTFGGSLLFVIIYGSVSVAVLETEPDLSKPIWASIPFIAEIDINISIDPYFYTPYVMQAAMGIFFMIALPFAIIVERFRLDPHKEIPFHSLFTKSLRESEQHNAAHYYFFVFGVFISAVLLPATATFGILCVLCFGDTYAGLIGKRCKTHRHTIPWEDDKCWEGAIAGFFATFITAILFVGWFLALILGIIFIIIDVITPNKLKVSDNFLYPLICVLVMGFFIYILNFNMDGVLSNYFNQLNTFFIGEVSP